jgi:hypothetical protein
MAAYTYNVDGYYLPSEAEDKLLKGPFKVMVSESYDCGHLFSLSPILRKQ